MVFIDESGTTSYTDRLFTTAAVWCAPTTREGYQSVLKPTARCVWETIEKRFGKKQNEIHYASGLKRYAGELLAILEAECHQDTTIIRNGNYWPGHPVAYTVATFHPNIESQIARGTVSFDCTLRSRAIVSLLRPLFLYRGEEKFDVSVILDDNIWKQAMDHCSRHIEDNLKKEGISISFSCESSRKASGLQLADLIVGITKDYYTSGNGQRCMIGLCTTPSTI